MIARRRLSAGARVATVLLAAGLILGSSTLARLSFADHADGVPTHVTGSSLTRGEALWIPKARADDWRVRTDVVPLGRSVAVDGPQVGAVALVAAPPRPDDPAARFTRTRAPPAV